MLRNVVKSCAKDGKCLENQSCGDGNETIFNTRDHHFYTLVERAKQRQLKKKKEAEDLANKDQ